MAVRFDQARRLGGGAMADSSTRENDGAGFAALRPCSLSRGHGNSPALEMRRAPRKEGIHGFGEVLGGGAGAEVVAFQVELGVKVIVERLPQQALHAADGQRRAIG